MNEATNQDIKVRYFEGGKLDSTQEFHEMNPTIYAQASKKRLVNKAFALLQRIAVFNLYVIQNNRYCLLTNWRLGLILQRKVNSMTENPMQTIFGASANNRISSLSLASSG